MEQPCVLYVSAGHFTKHYGRPVDLVDCTGSKDVHSIPDCILVMDDRMLECF